MDKWSEYKEGNKSNFFKAVADKFGDRFDLSMVDYVNNKTKIDIGCPIHGTFSIIPQSFVRSDYGCPRCGSENGGVKRGANQSKGKERFLKDANGVHDSRYDYSKVEYVSSRKKVCIVCPEHGEFWQTPKNHLNGYGCPKCGRSSTKRKLLKSKEMFVDESVKTHGDKYDYSEAEYNGAHSKICIICPEHGKFWQEPNNHVRGHGCPRCDNKLKTTNSFIQEAKLVHGERYDYSNVEYVDATTKVRITCPIHGEFAQAPFNHLQRHGCPKCVSPTSIWENEVADHIKSLGLEVERSNRDILKGREVDIYIPSKNIGIECDGLRWHSDFGGKGSEYHIAKTQQCSDENVRLIHIFEDEWAFKNEIWKSMLRNILTGSPDRIPARKCRIMEVSPKTSRDFLNENHVQGYANASHNYGLYFNGELVSLMTFGRRRINLGGKNTDGMFELVRFCNKLNTSVIGGASRLLATFIKEHDPKEIISYSDIRWSDGNMYRKLGFFHDHDSRPNYYYVEGMHRHNRFRFRKSILVKEGYDKNKTEQEIMKDRRFGRIYDCGCSVWKWRKATIYS